MTDDRKINGLKPVSSDKATKSGMSSHLLIPVDFSDRSMLAVALGFHFAETLNVTPVLLHVYPVVWYPNTMPEDFGEMYDVNEVEILSAIEERDMMKIAEKQFEKFRKRIKAGQVDGSIPDVKFTSKLVEGIADEEVLNYCRENNPRLVVMSTRGINKKAEELIGSVTAEVLDSCRVPVFTVPEKYKIDRKVALKKILMFCTLDSYDVEGLERMMITFNRPEVEIWLMPMESREGKVRQKLSALHTSLAEKWPNVIFHISDLEEKSVGSWVDAYIHNKGIQLVIAPNRKTSIFTRLFRPTVAHQCLFTVDTPMLALPVTKS